MSIQAIVEFPLHEVQTKKARSMDISIQQVCCICGNKIKNLDKAKSVQILTNGNIVSTDQDVAGSQGFFPVGSECVKKLQLNFAF